jgi:hypothetical protein
MIRWAHTLGLTALVLSIQPAETTAQSRQRVSLQGAGAVWIATDKNPAFDPATRFGPEAQARYTISRFSLGIGVAAQFPENQLGRARAMGFVEPRMLLAAGGGLALYMAGRLGVGKLICPEQCVGLKVNVTYGGGGGFLFRLNRRISADWGGEYIRVIKWSSSGYAMFRAGLSIGL